MDFWNDNGQIEAQKREKERQRNVKEYQRKFFEKKFKKNRKSY